MHVTKHGTTIQRKVTIFQSCEALLFVIIIAFKMIKYNIQGKNVNDLLGT